MSPELSTELGGEVLRQHGEFVRELARALTRDSGQAEDVEQDTWLRWFRRPPSSDARPRGWLTLVARGITQNRRRGEQRRTSVEARVAPGERLDSTPLDACVQAEQLERVIVAVRALEAPYRDVILARYFRGLPVRELALESGTSEETLRTRERRALEQLRAKLDREFGGRAAWAGVLGGFVPRATVALTLPGAVAAVAGVLALGSGAVLWLRAAEPATPAPAVAVLAEPAPIAASVATPSVTIPARQPAVTTPPAQPTGSSGSSSALVTSSGAEVRGTFLLTDSTPAANATWTLHGYQSNEEMVVRYGLPANWTDPSGTTDANGQLVASFEPPRAFQFVLEVKAPGHAGAKWRWMSLEPGRTLDLGTITLARGATIVGRLVDAQGEPVLGETWRVYAHSHGLSNAAGRSDVNVRGELDPVTGSFRLEDVQPGRNLLEAHSPMANWLRGQEVLPVAGETLQADLVYRGPRNSQRITLTVFCEPAYGLFLPAIEHLRLRGDDGVVRTAKKIAGSSQSFSFDELPQGLYLVEITDPRFKPWSQAGVAPGTALNPDLEPCSALELTLRDASGATLAPQQITVEGLGSNIHSDETVVCDGSVAFTGRIALFPGDHLVRVTIGGQREVIRVDGLGADETRSVVHTFGSAGVLAGRMTRASGAVMADEEVLLLAPALVDDSSASPILDPSAFASNPESFRKQLAATRTGVDGAFRFDLPGPGAYVVAARTADGARCSSSVYTLAAGQSVTDAALVVPMGAAVSGQLTVAGGSSAGLRLWIGTQSEGYEWSEASEHAQPLESDGSFHFTDLTAGSAKVRVLLPADESFAGGGFVRSNAYSTWIELGALTLTDGASLVQDFVLPAAPGRLTIDVTLNGAPAVGLAFLAEQAVAGERQGFELEGEAGPGGVCGPMLAFAGPWRLSFRGPDEEWLHMSDLSALVTSGGTTRVAVDITTASGRLRFFDAAGQPLAERDVWVRLERPDQPWPWRVHTDALGIVELTLATGPYRFALASDAAGTPVEWTATGPVSVDVEL